MLQVDLTHDGLMETVEADVEKAKTNNDKSKGNDVRAPAQAVPLLL